ncbi:hypothetical protein TNCV_3392341 [Trichonephila clavipes]|nr:hypothetical protein TNCV_3392341 [Trichonephila clavipes]
MGLESCERIVCRKAFLLLYLRDIRGNINSTPKSRVDTGAFISTDEDDWPPTVWALTVSYSWGSSDIPQIVERNRVLKPAEDDIS